MTIRGILFDKDGTLLDYHATWLPVNRRIAGYAARGDTALADELMQLAGYDAASGRVRSGSHFAAASNAEIAQLLCDHLGHAAPSDLHEAVDRFSVEGGAKSVMVAGTRQTLDRLSAAGLILGVATNDSDASMRASLKPHGILDIMSFAAGYDSGFPPKPAPDVIHGFCSACGLSPPEVAMVGDNAHDMEAGARASAGLKIGVLTGTSSAAELAPLCDLVLDSIADLPGHPALD